MTAKSSGRKISVKTRQYTLQISLCDKSFVKITLTCSISEINTYLHFTQKFKIAAKSGERKISVKTRQYTLQISLCDKSFVKITLACSISEINTYLHFAQKFKIAAKSGE